MESNSITIDAENFNQLLYDVALIKEILIANRNDSKGEPTDWAKKELAEARQIPDSELISSEEVKRMILAK